MLRLRSKDTRKEYQRGSIGYKAVKTFLLLTSRRWVTSAILAEELKVTVRTANRYLSIYANIPDLPIQITVERSGYQEMYKYSLDPAWRKTHRFL